MMADPVATVEKIVRIGLRIKDAVDTVRHNEEECNEIRRRVLRFSAILSQLQQTGMMNDSPALIGALGDLEETLERALKLVTACQERSTIRRLIAAGDLSKQLRRVKDDILNKVMLASFAITAHTTIVLLTIQSGGHPLLQQAEDASVPDISHSIRSVDGPRYELNGEENIVQTGNGVPIAPVVAIRKFSLSELKAAINGGEIVGEGGSFIVYKSVLKDGNVVAIKTPKRPDQLDWARTYNQLLLDSKFQHKNIVKVLGYGSAVGSSTMMARLLKRKNDEAKERKYVWVEEYVANGSLHMVIRRESRLDWPSLSRIIEGIAQGIHYLHEQHVVHMDMKPSNILLDFDMNPKITDFDLSIMLNGGEVSENCIAGTYGYIAPDYLADGIVSTKNDVYGFGITLLETIGWTYRSNAPFYDTNGAFLAGVMKPWNYSESRRMGLSDLPPFSWTKLMETMQVWEAWEAGKLEDLFDPSLFYGSQLVEIKRCVHVGLLCIQDDREDRPTMADVLEMLYGQKELPTPKKPSYIKTLEERPASSSTWSDSSFETTLTTERPGSPAAWSDGSLSPR